MVKTVAARRRIGWAACVLLAGCASAATPPAQVQGLFRTPSHVGGLRPGPTAGWYVAQQRPQYRRMGLARRATGSRAVMVAETAPLPLPSIVQITNVATGVSLLLRVDDRGAIGEDLVRLNSETADALGVAGDAPLLVRVSFVEPAIAYREGAPLRYAARRRAEAGTELAQAPAAAPPLVTTVRPPPAKSEAPIVTARMEAQPQLATPPPPPNRHTTASAEPPEPSATGHLRVQAAAFANPDNARRAVVMLAPAGRAQIETLHRADGVTLYRVFVACEAAAAESVRAKVAEIGFGDARIVRRS